jgi:RILP-like protein 1
MSIRIAMAMPSSKRMSSINSNDMLANSIEDVCVVDVYDLATDIGKECEKIIETHGTGAMAGLIPKMINALEVLEGLAHRNEIENSLIQELNERVIQLENEKLEKAEYRKRFEKVNVTRNFSFLFIC